MTMPHLLAATWSDGVFVFADDTRRHELAGHSVKSLARDHAGGTLGIVDGHDLCRRNREGVWATIATGQPELSCVLVVGDAIYVGTDDARVLRLASNGALAPLKGFDTMPGRDTWYAGSALVNGEVVGPPLGIRSMTATADEAVLLANVHVGGIARSTDRGVSWHPTIDIASDVHEVCAHATDPRTVIAAASTGLCISRDGGANWTIEREGLHASYCSAVAFSGDDILVAASADHFAEHGAVYRRSLHANGLPQPITGLPRRLAGIVDTCCIATLGPAIAVADKGGNLYASADAGASWALRDNGLPMVSSIRFA